MKTKIILEKGEAKKSISEMTPAEVRKISDEVFRIVTEKAEAVGQKPIIKK